MYPTSTTFVPANGRSMTAGRMPPAPAGYKQMPSGLSVPRAQAEEMVRLGGVGIDQPDTFQARLNTVSRLFFNPDYAYRNYRTVCHMLRQNPDVMEPLTARRLAVARLKWKIVPEDEKDPLQRRVCEEITQAWKRWRGFLRFRYALTDASWFGKYACNVVYGYDRRKMRYAVADWKPIHGDKLMFDQKTGQVGVMVSSVGDYLEADPESRIEVRHGPESRVAMLSKRARKALVLHQHDIEDGEYWEPQDAGSIHGVGLRLRVWQYANTDLTTMQWFLVWLQRWAAGTTKGWYEDGNDAARERVRQALIGGTSEEPYLLPRSPNPDVRPDVNDIEHVEHSTAGMAFMNEFVEKRIVQPIKRMIVGQTATSEPVPGGGLNSNVADQHRDTFQGIVEYDGTNLGESIDRDLLCVWFALNYPGADWEPRYETVIEEVDVKAWMEAARTFRELGGEIGEEQARDVLGIDKPDKDDRILGQSAAVPGAAPQAGGMDPGQVLPADNGMAGVPGEETERLSYRYTDRQGKRQYVPDLDQVPDYARGSAEQVEHGQAEPPKGKAKRTAALRDRPAGGGA